MQTRVQRDLDLDMLRAFGIAWVIVIHAIYWPNIIKQGVGISFLLIEMPLIFFLIGGSNNYAKKRTLKDFYYRRIIRVLKPYEFYAISVIILSILSDTYSKGITMQKFIQSWLNPIGKHYSSFAFLNWHLWFITVYFVIVLFLPLLLKAHEYNFSKYFLLLFPAVLLALDILEIVKKDIIINDYVFYVLFYGFWTVAGFYFLYMKNLHKKREFSIPIYTIALSALLLIFYIFINDFIVFGDFSMNMQKEKFPPTFIFFCYSLFSMSMLFILSPYIVKMMSYLCNHKFFKHIIESYIDNGFTIYLFHPFVFLILYNMLKENIKKTNNIIIFFLFLASAFILSSWIGILVSRLEKAIIILLKNFIKFVKYNLKL